MKKTRREAALVLYEGDNGIQRYWSRADADGPQLVLNRGERERWWACDENGAFLDDVHGKTPGEAARRLGVRLGRRIVLGTTHRWEGKTPRLVSTKPRARDGRR